MVGRNKRFATKEVVDAVSEEEDIICLDEPTKPSRKSRTVRNIKPNVPEKSEPEKKTEEESVFAGIDIEGVSEEEKRQIKEALLASAKDQGHVTSETMRDDSRANSTLDTSSSCAINEISEIEVEESVSEGNKTVQEEPPLSDVETQPPSDSEIEEVQMGLHLDQSTLEDSHDNIFETDSVAGEDENSTLREVDIDKVDIEDVAVCKKRKKVVKTSSPLPKRKNSSQEELMEDASGTPISSEIQEKDNTKDQLNEAGNSQGFEIDLQNDLERDQGNTVGQSILPEGQSSLCQELDVSQKTGQSVSQETSHSNASDSKEKRASQKSSSQRILDSVHDASGASGSQKRAGASDRLTTRSSSQDNKIGTEHVPLKRHYRGVKTAFQNVRHDKYFGDSCDKEVTAMAIYQLFETYRKLLYKAQKKCRKKMPWPEPVKTGQHQSRTLDVKKRGVESICFDLSDEGDNSQQERKTESGRESLKRNVGNERENGSDDVLPDLTIEYKRGSEPFSRRRLTRRGLHTKPVDNEIMSADTQPYDIDNDDFVPNRKNRSGRQSVECANKDSLHDNTKPTRGRPSRKLGLNTERSSKKVLAAETQQEDVDFQEAITRSKMDSQRSLPETQLEDDGFDWLNVKQQNGKVEFENQMHRAKLIGYSIPKHTQMHSKSHQKIIRTEQTNNDNLGVEMEGDSSETTSERQFEVQQKKEAKEDCENSPHLRGRKRKAKRQMSVTLVEDTQDPDEEVDKSNVRGKRKRNCFKINSESEEESIAESQDVDGPSENSSCEKKLNFDNSEREGRNKTKSKSEGFISSFVGRVKKFVTPSKTKAEDEHDKRSQSPVISKKRLKLFSKSCDRYETEYETEAFNEFRSASPEKKAKKVRAEAKKGKVQTNCDESGLIEENGIRGQVKRFDKNNLIEENGISEGVKRFISRPSSKDSNASDNLSTTSSQMSNNILDEKGDIYSTQYCEIRSRRGKDRVAKGHQKQRVNKREEELQEVLMLDSDDEAPVLDKPKATNYVKTYSKKLPVVEGFRSVEKRDYQQVPRKECISQYFDKAQRQGDKNVPIDLDPDEEELEQTQKHLNGSINNDIITEHRDHPGMSTKTRVVPKHKETSVKVPVIPVHDQETEQKVKQTKVDINHSSFNTSRRVTRQHQSTNTVQHLNIESENPPLMLNNLNKATVDSSNTLEQYFSSARPKTRHTEINTNLYEQRPINKRQRKVSETISSAEYEARVTGVQTRGCGTDVDQDGLGEEWGHVKGSLRKGPGQHYNDEDNYPDLENERMEMVVCPLCNNKFPSNIIEQHAAMCVGPPEDHETMVSGKMTAEEYIHHLAEEHPHLSQEEIYEQLHHHHLHHDHVGGLHGHTEHLHETDDEDEEVGLIIQNDVNVEDVVKDIRCSPGEEGEVEACYICDAQIPKGKPYQIHLNRCLKIAAHQQAEVDKKGYSRVFTWDDEEAVQVRSLRGRQVNPADRGGTPRVLRHQMEDTPPRHRNLNPEPNSESPVSRQGGEEHVKIITVGKHHYDQGDHGSEHGATKKMMLRGKRNKAGLNDDGSSGSSRY